MILKSLYLNILGFPLLHSTQALQVFNDQIHER